MSAARRRAQTSADESGLLKLRPSPQRALTLTDRPDACAQCGLVLDPDHHAARTSLARGTTVLA